MIILVDFDGAIATDTVRQKASSPIVKGLRWQALAPQYGLSVLRKSNTVRRALDPFHVRSTCRCNKWMMNRWYDEDLNNMTRLVFDRR